VNNSTNCSYGGYLRDTAWGSGVLSLVKNGSGSLTLSGGCICYTGGTTINSGTLVLQETTNTNFLTKGIVNNATLEFANFWQNVAYSGSVSGSGNLVKWGSMTLTMTGSNSYTGTTSIRCGALQADFGVGIPSNSFLSLDGGVLQSGGTGATSYTRSLGLSGGAFQWTANGGGFSAGAGPATVNVGGSGATLIWGNSVGSQLVGPLMLNSTTSTNVLTFQNPIDLHGGDRTIQVNDNTNLTTDSVVISSAISDSIGGASLTKSGAGDLLMTGPGNTYSGMTTIRGGNITLNKSSGYAIPGNLTLLAADAITHVILLGANQISPSCVVTFGGGYWPHLELLGHATTLAGISDTFGTACIEDAQDETGYADGTLTINSSNNYSFNGIIRDHNAGGGKILLTKNGPGTLTLFGGNISYSGNTTIQGGALQADDGDGLPSASYLTLDGGVLQSNSAATFARGLGASGATFRWTTNGGGFSAGAGAMTVRIGGGTGSVNWSNTSGANLAGILKLNSSTAANVVTFQNGIYLNGAVRTIQVDDNPGSSADYAVISGVISNGSGTGGITKTGNGLLSLTANNTYTGLTTVSGGTLQIGAGSNAGSVTGNIAMAGGTLSFNRSDAVTYTSKVSGTGTLLKTGAGTLTMSGANGFSGNIAVNNGTLDYSGNSTLPAGNYTVSAGTLNIGSLSNSIGTFQLAGGTVSGAGTLTSNAAYDLRSGAAGVGLGGSVGLNKTTSGTVSLTGSLPGGSYTVSGGVLNLNGLSKSIGAFQITGGTVSGTGTLTSNAAYDIQGGMVGLNLAGASIGLNKSGLGTAVLSGADSYAGLTTVVAGTLELGPSAQNAVLNLGGADIQAGKMLFDYTGIPGQAAAIENALTASCNGGAWNTGKFRDSTAAATGLTLGWADNGSSGVTVMATLPGDLNLDGVVNQADLDIMAGEFGIGTTWAAGDANYDGVINLGDLDLLMANFGKSVPSGSGSGDFLNDSSIATVPEPGTLALLAAGLIGLLAYAWKKRK
jgi:autotransporter-associated beta strand protein